MQSKPAELILENGIRFTGTAFGYVHDVVGEVVFSTSMTGYQEAITDPSFCGQMVVLTYPLIGNYGINLEDMEADKPALTALIVREKCDYPNNFRTEMDLDGFLRQNRVLGLEGIDTRALTRIIRDAGCKVYNGEISEDKLKRMSFNEARDNLMTIKGVGEKVANCVLLYGLSFTNAFPVDVWMKRIMEYMYFGEDTKKEIIENFAYERYGEYAGYAQQYLFYYGREKGLGK